jgi:hypothetical protein
MFTDIARPTAAFLGWNKQMTDEEINDALMRAFVQGAKWWEFECTGATMWQSDQALALAAADKRLKDGTLRNRMAP